MNAALQVLSAIWLGVAPLVFYAAILWWVDRYEREPWSLMAAAFLWGFMPAALLAILLGTALNVPLSRLLDPDGLSFRLASVAITGPLIEETVKGAGVLLTFIVFHDEIDSVFDGIVYGGMVGFGFGAVENLLYLMATDSVGELLLLSTLRSVLFGLNHAMYTSFFGIGLVLAWTRRPIPAKALVLIGGFSLAVLTHSIHNASMMLASVSAATFFLGVAADGLAVLFVVGIMLYALLQEGLWIRQYLAEEVSSGVISEQDWRMAASLSLRLRSRLDLLFGGSFDEWRRLGRFQHACAELAFKKRRLGRQPSRAAANRVEQLRQEVAQLRPDVAEPG